MKVLSPWTISAVALLCLGSNTLAQEPGFLYETIEPGVELASGHRMVVDGQGNAYVIAHDHLDGVNLDIVVLKLDPDGGVLWREVIPGSEHDYAADLTLDPNDDVLIAGWTDSADFPLVNPIDDSLTGFREAFVLKLSGVDASILYSSYLGGDYLDEGAAIALGSGGDIYLAGTTESSDFPTVDALQDTLSSPSFSDVFLTRLSPDGQSILYSSYLGGGRDDRCAGMRLDSQGRIYLAGTTDSTDFPSVNAIQDSYAGGDRDLFVSRLSGDGQTLETSSYLGGEDIELLGGLRLDSAGHVYLAGSTRSVLFPTTPGAYQPAFAGAILGCEVPFGQDYNCEDGFLVKLDLDAPGLVYGTYLGGSDVDECRDLAVDATGAVRLVGYTVSADFPPDGVFNPAVIFVSRIDASGAELDYTLLKDSGSANAGHGVTVDDNGGTYFTGAVNVPADIYVAKLGPDGPEQALLHRAPVASFQPGWRTVALPLSGSNDDETPPFPAATQPPGSKLDDLTTAAPLVLYRLLLADGGDTGNRLRATKRPTGTRLSY